ncbi:MAG: Beta-barrel assembly-enhancing protease [Pseudidiomarina mangrovi]|nr:MAG: Beta-barrel assembly-enhancing protease [Pseudidiomarina mangrovi]
MQLSKLLPSVIITLLLLSTASSAAQQNRLPEIGTAGISVMSVERERTFGDLYMRQIRAQAPVIGDPVLNEYLKDMGTRLVREADDVRFPFTFFWINQNDINAFAFFGGYIGFYTGLIAETETESELASVMAHEVAHVSQRHIVRNMERMQNASPNTIVAMLGAVLLGMISPDLGMAALSTTIAGAQQLQINYTRQFEQEADRVGLTMLVRAGYDPMGAPGFFGRLAEKHRYATKVPQMLLTHPVSEARIADTRVRAEALPRPANRDESRYLLAKARVKARHLQLLNEEGLRPLLREQLTPVDNANRYALAIVLLDQGNAEQAEQVLAPLLDHEPMNGFYLDVQSDILLALGRANEALKLLEKAYMREPREQVITVNFANVAIQAKQPGLAIDLLRDYLLRDDGNVIALQLLVEAYRQQGNSAAMHETRAELYAMHGAFDQAINNLHLAHKGNQSELDRRRLQARIEQLMAQKRQLQDLFG